MDLLLQREPAIGQAVLGDLFVNGLRKYRTLERLDVLIPIGRYKVLLTPSYRATVGTLWSPLPDHRLPLVCDVPGRDGIRIHALNDASESDGCIGVGMMQIGHTKIGQSRIALIALVNQLIDAEKLEGPTYLQIVPPHAERTQTV